MNLRNLNDKDLLNQIKNFVQSERDTIVKILHHLREIERRKLYSDLGFKSLFDYAINDLKYSEGQACRRIQAMRLMKDLPEVEEKIANGELSLSNVQQAQSFFREAQNNEPTRVIDKAEKLDVLARLENKSVREAQKELLKLQPDAALPKERERVITETTSEVRFLLSDNLKTKLEAVRSLLGPKGAAMTYAELFDAMSDLSLNALKAKHFGRKRAESKEKQASVSASEETKVTTSVPPTSAVEHSKTSPNSRYISKRDRGCCVNCGGSRNLNYDHIMPVALGGKSEAENLRLLCFHCNQRASIKIFGEWQSLVN
jgi:hypothetical protein